MVEDAPPDDTGAPASAGVGRSRRWFTNAVIGVLLAAAVAPVVTSTEIYPYSAFPMYSNNRQSPFTYSMYVVTGLDAEGEEIGSFRGPLGTSIMLAWLRRQESEPELGSLVGEVLLEYNRHRLGMDETELVGFRVERVDHLIAPYPAEPGADVLDTEVTFESRG